MNSTFFNDFDSDEMKHLEERYESLSPCKKIEFNRNIHLINVCNQKIECVEHEMKAVRSNIKSIAEKRKYEVFLLVAIFLSSIVFNQLFEFTRTIEQIIFAVIVLVYAMIIMGMLVDIGDLIGFLSLDKSLKLERSLLWIDFKNLTFTNQLDVDLIRYDDLAYSRFDFNNEDRAMIYERVLKNIESI